VFSTAILPRLPHLCQNAAFQYHLQLGKQKIKVSGDDSHVIFNQEFGDVMMQQPVLLLPKFGVKSSHIFMQLL
jgi:hypothetical protein